MFTLEVDKEIKLALVEKSLAPEFARLARSNYTYLEKWLAWPAHCKSELQFADFISQSLHDYAEGKSMVCAIFYRGELVGTASFNAINHQLKKAVIGYWIVEAAQGKGIITRVCRELIRIAFDELKMHKVQISAAEENNPSRAVCERLGMSLEGIISHAENLNGRLVSHAIYGILKE